MKYLQVNKINYRKYIFINNKMKIILLLILIKLLKILNESKNEHNFIK